MKSGRASRMQASAERDWPFLRVFDLAAMQAITTELSKAREKHPGFPSIHHALSVIREEYLELEQAAFVDGVDIDTPEALPKYDAMKKEAIQLAATCIRLLTEL